MFQVLDLRDIDDEPFEREEMVICTVHAKFHPPKPICRNWISSSMTRLSSADSFSLVMVSLEEEVELDIANWGSI